MAEDLSPISRSININCGYDVIKPFGFFDKLWGLECFKFALFDILFLNIYYQIKHLSILEKKKFGSQLFSNKNSSVRLPAFEEGTLILGSLGGAI